MILDSYLIAVILAEPWPINFLIPLANSMSDTLTLPSNTLWEVAQFSIAEAMDISPKSLNIAYKFSTHGACDPYLTLSSVINWVGLIQMHLTQSSTRRRRKKK